VKVVKNKQYRYNARFRIFSINKINIQK